VVTAVEFSPDGTKLASGSGDGDIRLWDTGTGRADQLLKGNNGYITSMRFSPDGSKLVSGSFESICIWNAGTGRAEHTLETNNDYIEDMAFSPDGSELASCSFKDGSIFIWEIATGQI
jgi:WD40 repeat protein